MFTLIDRYFAKAVSFTLLGVSTVLLLTFLSNRLVRYFMAAATGNLSREVIFPLLGLEAVRYAILLMPLSLYLAILMTVGRMHRDSEMTALAACGIGSVRLYRPVLLIALPLAVMLGWFSLQIIPWANGVVTQIVERAQRDLKLNAIAAGQFRQAAQRNRVIYVEKVSSDSSKMDNVFIQLRIKGKIVLLSSRKGTLDRDPKTGAVYLVLLDGYRYEGTPGSANYRIVKFAKYGVLMHSDDALNVEPRRNAISSWKLLQSKAPEDAGELQWRLAVPIATVILALLALPLGRVRPRQGSYGKMFIAVFVYMIYFNMLSIADSWTERAIIPPSLGLWWVHALMLLAVVALLVKQYGFSWVRTRLRSGIFR